MDIPYIDHIRPSDAQGPTNVTDNPVKPPRDAHIHARDAFLAPLDPVMSLFLSIVDNDSSFSRIREHVLAERPEGELRSWDIQGYTGIGVVDGNTVEVWVDDDIFTSIDQPEFAMPFDAFERLFTQYEAICRPDGDS